jgi:hypothetical protein
MSYETASMTTRATVVTATASAPEACYPGSSTAETKARAPRIKRGGMQDPINNK